MTIRVCECTKTYGGKFPGGAGVLDLKNKKDPKELIKDLFCRGECLDVGSGREREFHLRRGEYLTTHSECETRMFFILQ